MTEATCRHIVVPLDGSVAAERALTAARTIAAGVDGRLTLVGVLRAGDPEDNVRHYLEEMATGTNGVAVAVEVLRGDRPPDRIVEFLDAEQEALVCCSTRARSTGTGPTIGSVAETIVRRSPVPVLLIAPHASLPDAGQRFGDLLLCIDDAATAAKLLPVAAVLAAALAGQTSLVEVVDPPTDPDEGERMTARETSFLETLRTRLTEQGTPAGPVEVAHGLDVPAALAALVATRSDPIVAIGSHGRSAGDRLREGSVTVGLLRTLGCPLLVVGPDA